MGLKPEHRRRHMYEWRKMETEESDEIQMTVALECPHCKTIVMLEAELVRDYVREGQLAMYFLCPYIDCFSNSTAATEYDKVAFDLRPANITDEDMCREIRNGTKMGKIYQNIGTEDSKDKWLSLFGWEGPEKSRKRRE